MFDVKCFRPFVGASDIILSCLYGNMQGKMFQRLARTQHPEDADDDDDDEAGG